MYSACVVSILLKGVDKLIVWDVFAFFWEWGNDNAQIH